MKFKPLAVFICSWITLITGCLIYFPIQYTIFYPYFNHDWKSSKSMVESVKRYRIFSSQDSDSGAITYVYYSLFDVRVNITGYWLQGFACGCSDATSLTAESVLNGAYPYQYSICSDDMECGNMLLMPSWFCNECNKCTEFLTQEEKDCKYFLRKAYNGIDSVEDIPVGYKIDYPTQYSTFIQVIFMDDPFYFDSDYIGLQVVGFWIMIILPAALIILHFIYWGLNHIKKAC